MKHLIQNLASIKIGIYGFAPVTGRCSSSCQALLLPPWASAMEVAVVTLNAERETRHVQLEISRILNTDLNMETLSKQKLYHQLLSSFARLLKH
jgi:hypothetical protein